MTGNISQHPTNSNPPQYLCDEIPEGLSNHIVIINVNEKLPEIIKEIQNDADADNHVDIVIFVQDKALWKQHPSWHPTIDGPHRIFVVEGCPGNTEALRCTGIDTCQTAVILADPTQGNFSDAKGTLIALAIEASNPDVHTLIEVVTSGNRIHLLGTEVNEVVCMGELTEALLAQNVISPGVLNIINSMLTVSLTPGFTTMTVPKQMVGMTYKEALVKSIDDESPEMICGFVKNAGRAGNRFLIRTPVLNPDERQKQTRLDRGDAFIIAR